MGAFTYTRPAPIAPGYHNRFSQDESMYDNLRHTIDELKLTAEEVRTIAAELYMMSDSEYRKHIKDDQAHIDFSGRP